MGFLTIVSLILIIAKCLGLITISWFACFAPFLVGLIVKIVFVIIIFLIAIFAN